MRWSAQIHACFPVAGVTWDAPKENHTPFHVRGCHPLWPAFPDLSTRCAICQTCSPLNGREGVSHDTAHATPIRLTHASV